MALEAAWEPSGYHLSGLYAATGENPPESLSGPYKGILGNPGLKNPYAYLVIVNPSADLIRESVESPRQTLRRLRVPVNLPHPSDKHHQRTRQGQERRNQARGRNPRHRPPRDGLHPCDTARSKRACASALTLPVRLAVTLPESVTR